MANEKKVVLAYSGGLDTSVIVKWLQLEGFKVICLVVDVGQRENFSVLKKKAIKSGAFKCIVTNVQKEFVRDYVFPAIQFNAVYEGRYLLGTSLARPLIAKKLIETACNEKAGYIAHGATGKGNDQVRFELGAYALAPDIKIIAPWRDERFTKTIKGRTEAIAYAKKHHIPVKATVQKPWSSDENLLHISFEAGILENPAVKPKREMFEFSNSPQQAPDKVAKIEIEFKKGFPVKVNNQGLTPDQILKKLNKIGGKNGIGRIDIVESRYVGMKSRGVYETPGGAILLAAHRDIEGLTLDREVIRLKDSLMPRYAAQVYNGFWFSREIECLHAFLAESQRHVNGKVNIELYKGNITIVGRNSFSSLYDESIASMEDDAGAYNQNDATGFIKLNALPLKMQEKRRK
ncbi:MAG TPA: argininosuccinate synthase [Spirochaetota bacterium]|nr:argininosuccinate synthase [Spirochaetota bacterium]